MLALTTSCFAAQEEEEFLRIYLMIQEADGFTAKGQTVKAAEVYTEAQAALKKLQTENPEWHKNIVKFRQDYISEKLAPIAAQLSTTKPGLTPAPGNDTAPGLEVKPAENTAELQNLRLQIDQLGRNNAELQAKLREALSVQPAAADPKELAKAQEEINNLKKERDLLKASLDQTTSRKPEDPSLPGQEKKLIDDITAKLAQQTELVASLQKENDLLKSQIIALKAPATTGDASAMAQELAITRMTLDTLQQTNVALRADNILKQQQLTEVTKERDTLKFQLSAFALATVSGNAPAPVGDNSSLAQQLKSAQAKLAIYEAKAIPFTEEEKAFLKQPGQQSQPDLKVSMTAPKKKPIEFPPGAAPIVEEAMLDLRNAKYDRAEKKFQDVLRQDEKNIYVLSYLAAAQMHQNHYEDAEKTLQKAMAIDPEDGGALSILGELKYYQEKYDAAIDALSLAAKAQPDDARLQFYLGRSLLQKGQRASAETALRKAVQISDDYGEAHYWLAFIYATANPPFTQLARWHYYEKALKNGYAPNKDFENLLDKKEPAPAPTTTP
jgi:Tfp pilus assembly protein PilF